MILWLIIFPSYLFNSLIDKTILFKVYVLIGNKLFIDYSFNFVFFRLDNTLLLVVCFFRFIK